ncbi:MAG: hypothetical protein IJ587_09450 [Synergistaceae bacterium]|nr:hypothetical protein [Synergistaceae bacterium]
MIIKRKKKGITYIYERTTVDGKRHEKAIGKVDENGNEIYYADSRDKHASGELGQEKKFTKVAVFDLDGNLRIELRPIPDVEAHLAKKVISGTTKLEQVIFDPRKNPVFYDTNITAVDINVGNRGKNTITTIASIDFNNMKKMGVSISHEKWITPFDREILSIVSSLYAAGNTYQSPQMIFQAMSGNKEKVKLTPEIRAKIIESLRKLRATTIEIDASQEEKAGWSKKGKYEGSLLPSERVEVITLNGQKVVDCIHFLRNSPLYDYAEGKNQISRVNIEMLQAPVNNTTENIELKFYLLRLISSMKNSKSKLKPVIRYDSLYEYLGIDENNTSDILHKKKDIRDRVKKILNFWVEQGFIRSFEEEKEGKNIAKVKISS